MLCCTFDLPDAEPAAERGDAAELDTPTRRLAKRQAMGTGSSPHRGLVSPPSSATNGIAPRAQAAILPTTPFAGSSPAGPTSRQATPVQGRQAAAGAPQSGTRGHPHAAQQQPLLPSQPGGVRSQSAPNSRPPSAAAPLLPPGLPGGLRTVTSADATIPRTTTGAAGARGAAAAASSGGQGAGGGQAGAYAGRVRFGADVILSPPTAAGTIIRASASPAGVSSARGPPSNPSPSNGISSGRGSGGGGGGMALQMSAGQYNQLRNVALQQQGRGASAGHPVARTPAQTVMEVGNEMG